MKCVVLRLPCIYLVAPDYYLGHIEYDNPGLHIICKCVFRLMNVDVHLSNDKLVASYRLPGLTFAEFNRVGKPALWTILKAVEVNRIVDLKAPDFLSGLYKDGSDYTTMVVSQIWEMTPEFYQRAAINRPLLCHTSMNDIGKTSANLLLDVHDVEDDKLLISNIRRVAFVQPSTQRATPVPEFFRSLVAEGRLRPNTKPRVELPSDVPIHHFEYKVTSVTSDMDFLDHVNQSQSIRYCLDATHSGWKKGSIAGFGSIDPDYWEVRRVEIQYAQQLYPGDEVTVFGWEEMEESELSLRFVLKHGKNVAIRCRLLFFSAVKPKL